MTALSAPSATLACRWRSLDLARVRGSEAMATPRVMNKFNQRASMRVVELAEHGARSTLGVLVLGHLAEENEARPLQGFCNPGGVDDVVEWCVQVHH
jgi:hypothetical protein